MTIPELGNRITERALLAGVALTAHELQQLTKYYELLAQWNQRVNLTALDLDGLTDASLDRIVIEPIVSKGLIGFKSGVWFDLGSGGGSPAIPLKILLPDLALTLVESKSRKSAFLREAVRHLGLSVVSVWTGRIENLLGAFSAGTVQLVTVRGVKVDDALLGTSAELLADGGSLVAFGTGAVPPVESFPFSYRASTHLPAGTSAVHLFVRHTREQTASA